LGVIYGDYPSREAANAALAKLPETIRASRPYIRTTSKLR
jgi:septal ring-binding cell division protein DamX